MPSEVALHDRVQEAQDRAAEAEADLAKWREAWTELRTRVVARTKLAESVTDHCVADEGRGVLRLMDTLRPPCA
jgi:hypothetical protein